MTQLDRIEEATAMTDHQRQTIAHLIDTRLLDMETQLDKCPPDSEGAKYWTMRIKDLSDAADAWQQEHDEPGRHEIL